MRKLIESSFVSLDGIVTAEKLAPHWGPEGKAWALAELDKFDAFLFGRVTYETFAPRWSAIEDDPYMDRINRMPKHIASRTLRDDQMTWGATLLKGDAAAEIRRLKNQPGKDIIKYGTGDLDRLLISHQLIDEFHFAIADESGNRCRGERIGRRRQGNVTLTGKQTGSRITNCQF